MPIDNEKPTLFIGSSGEGLKIVRAVQSELDKSAKIKAWDQSVFGLSLDALHALEKAAKECDFAVLIATPDDLTTRRQVTAATARDNVLFELGLFMGAIGSERCFLFVAQDPSLHLPSDLDGITTGRFSWPVLGFDDAVSKVSTACAKVIQRVEALGPRSPGSVEIIVRGCAVTIVRGDIVEFDRSGPVLLLPTNVFFDTTSEGKIVETRSALGAVLDKRRRENAVLELDTAIDKELQASSFEVIPNQIGRKPGRKTSYALGSVIRASSPPADLILAALTNLVESGTAYQSHRPSNFFPEILGRLWANIGHVRVRDELVMPVLGSGFGGLSREIALTQMLYSLDKHMEARPEIRVCDKLIVVVRHAEWGSWVHDVVASMKILPHFVFSESRVDPRGQ